MSDDSGQKEDLDRNSIATTGQRSMSANGPRVSRELTTPVKLRYKQALILMQSGELSRAEQILRQISDDHPNMAGPFINLGIIAMKEGRWQDSEDLFSNAQTLIPDKPEVYNYLGVIYRQQGEFEKARVVYLKAIEQDEEFSNAYLNLGILFDLYLSDYLMAKKYYQQYQALKPEDQMVKNWLLDLDRRLQVRE